MAHSFNVPVTHNFPAMEFNKSKPNEWGLDFQDQIYCLGFKALACRGGRARPKLASFPMEVKINGAVRPRTTVL